jgi:hypothetical protein
MTLDLNSLDRLIDALEADRRFTRDPLLLHAVIKRLRESEAERRYYRRALEEIAAVPLTQPLVASEIVRRALALTGGRELSGA